MKMSPTAALMHHAQTRPTSAAFVFHEEVPLICAMGKGMITKSSSEC